MVREANGQYDSIRAKSVKRCLFGGSRELQFLNMRKASYSFHRNLIQLHAEKTSPKIYKMVQSLFADPFISHARNEGIIYTLERDFFLFLTGGSHIYILLSVYSSLSYHSTSNQFSAC